jgi:hypothetical protein
MLAPELLERLALLQDPWQHHAPTLALPWASAPGAERGAPHEGSDVPTGANGPDDARACLPLHGVHELVLRGAIDAPPLHALLSLVAAACRRTLTTAESPCGAEASWCVAWVGHAVIPSPVVMRRHGLDLARQVIVPGARTPAERLWTFEEAARSGRCIAVVVDGSGWDAAMSRRAQLASAWQPQRMPVLALAWRAQGDAAQRSACTTRWAVQPMPDPGVRHARPAWGIEPLRDRRGMVGRATTHGSLCEPGPRPAMHPWSIAS